MQVKKVLVNNTKMSIDKKVTINRIFGEQINKSTDVTFYVEIYGDNIIGNIAWFNGGYTDTGIEYIVNLKRREQGMLTGPYTKTELVICNHKYLGSMCLWIRDDRISCSVCNIRDFDSKTSLPKLDISEKTKNDIIRSVEKQLVIDENDSVTEILNKW